MSANVKWRSMNAYASRDAYFAKPSSISATSDRYWSTSTSAGTPGG